MQGTVRALFVTPEKKGTPVSVSTVHVTQTGFDGDFHSRLATRRQVLLISSNVLSELQITPGAVFENVVVDGLDVMSLVEGQKLKMGDATFEVTVPCEPCTQMDRIRSGLRHALKDRRGMFVKVVSTGTVQVGDTVSVGPALRVEG